MFKDRREAGLMLSSLLKKYRKDSVILALARGGVIVGAKISAKLKIPLFILPVKKIGFPKSPELALGALAPENVVYWNDRLLSLLNVDDEEKKRLLREKNRELKKQSRSLGVKDIDIRKKTAILVDDGVATGASAVAGALFAKKKGAARIILVTPIISAETQRYISRYFDIVLALRIEDDFSAVGEFYEEFPQVEDKDILDLKL